MTGRTRDCCRFAVLLVVLVAVSGCGRFTFLYGFAEAAIVREAKFHLDLDAEDRAFVEAKIAALMQWHSRVMLPRYADFLEAQADVADRGAVKRQDVDAAVSDMRRLLGDLVEGAAPFTAEVLVGHTDPARLRYLEARMDERLAERWEAAESPLPERVEDRAERIVDNLERLVGDLNDAQSRIVLRYATATAGDNARWLRARAGRQRVFTEFLSRQPGEREIADFIHMILLRPYEVVDPDYKAVSDARWSRFGGFLYEMTTTFSPEQRATLSETLRGYAAEMRTIAGRATL